MTSFLPKRIPALAGFAMCLSVGLFPALSQNLHAQNLISAGIGVGAGVGDRNSNVSGKGAHGLAFVQVKPPLLPVGARADATYLNASQGGGSFAITASAVVFAPLPVVQPYAMAGWGKYGVGKDGEATGWNVGVGTRVNLGTLKVFGEVRRHQRISRDLLTIGLSL